MHTKYCTLYQDILENSYPAKHVCQNYHIFWFIKLSHLRILCKDSFGFRFALADACRKYTYLPEVVVSSAGSSIFDYARGSTQMGKKNRSRIYDLGVVPTRGNKSLLAYRVYKKKCNLGIS